MASYNLNTPFSVPVGFRSMSTSKGVWDGAPVVLHSSGNRSAGRGKIATTPFDAWDNNCLHAWFDVSSLTSLPTGWTSTRYGTSASLPVLPGGSAPYSCILNWGSTGSMDLVLDRRNDRYKYGEVHASWKPFGSGMVFCIITNWREGDTQRWWNYGTCCYMTLTGSVMRSRTNILGGTDGYTGQKMTVEWGWDYIPATADNVLGSGKMPSPRSAVPEFRDPISAAQQLAVWTVPDQVLGELATECISNAQLFQGNGIAYIADLLTMKSFIKGSLETIKHMMSRLKSADAAKAYLSWHYGAKLTISDSKNLFQAMKDYSYRVSTSRISRVGSVRQLPSGAFVRMSMYLSPYDGRNWELLRTLNEFDLLPTPGNLWDLIPFSFVIDWLFHIDQILTALDAQSTMSVIPVLKTCVSVKGGGPVPIKGEFVGTAHVKFYRRTFINGAVNPRIPITSPTPSGLVDHIVEGSSLLVIKLGD